MTYRPVSSIVGVAESKLGTVTDETSLRMMACRRATRSPRPG